MDFIDLAKESAIEAGQLLKDGFGTCFKIDSKEGKQNLVTEYDLKSQKLIIEKIKGRFPNHQFLAEEGNTKETRSSGVVWIIDPLDGTVNFAHKIPAFAVSIAASVENEIVAGAIYHPMLDELFAVEKGSGAYLGTKKLACTNRKDLSQALLSTGFPYNAHENPHGCIDRFVNMIKKGVPIRRIGVASLDLAYVAAGRFDAFWEIGLHSWDMAAGKLLIEESGGKVTGYKGENHPIFGYFPLLATNGPLHDEMVDFLKGDI